MQLIVVPPLTDFTTEVMAPAGAEVLDLNARIVERLADPSRLQAAARRPAGGTAEGPLGALLELAAAAVLERGVFDDAHLRAVGTALRLAADPAVRLDLDRLELAEGSTQSSRDVLGAAGRCELFRPEIELAAEAAAGRRAHVVVDAGRQLPAAFALVAALGAERVTLCGRLVARQRAALRRVPELAGVELLAWSPARAIRPSWYDRASGRPQNAGRARPDDALVTRSGKRVRWVTGACPPPADGPWAGRLDAVEAAAWPRDALARCRGLTIIATRVDFLAAVTGLNGVTVDLRRLLSAIAPGVPVACELVLGAPGMDAGVVGESVELLAAGAGGVRLAGLRPYRMAIRTPWAGPSVRVPPERGNDLVRWIRFDAPGTMRAYEVAAMISDWLGRLPGLPAGRLAACSVAGQEPASAWDPCAEVVRGGAGPDGGGPGTFAVSLRSGRSLRLRPYQVAPVARLAADDPHALDTLPERARTELTAGLARAGVLRGREGAAART
ncbi:hypothetical protein FH608_012185 [Nonomuraea phyllanthi]|uniref:Uncharacterized protein n=1 Tax=Nonomuraea phyllanthi TaxID=2219224 RepID=A0A5C4WN93_9ACTN|nr:hypothetical protein [Nonomuraea phyllanthi]KAB8195143.1 hypothetical protein FH608_012185 [Nonomuraea phyllanthi]